MTESSYYADLTKYYAEEALRIKKSITWEAKFTRTSYLNFKCLPYHQEEFLLQSERSFGYKIPDTGIAKKPFDGLAIFDAHAVFVAIYFVPRKTEIYEIPIRDFLTEKYKSGNKSLTKERAAQIGTPLVL